jgi:hypothetical protein
MAMRRFGLAAANAMPCCKRALSLSPIFCSNPIWTDFVLLPSALDGHLKGNKQTLVSVTLHIVKSIETTIT